VRRERVLQSGVALDESLNIGDLAREKSVKHLVLHKKDSIFLSRQISCERGLAGCHLSADENQFRRGAHAVVRLITVQITFCAPAAMAGLDAFGD
jgi:hypothetical protein